MRNSATSFSRSGLSDWIIQRVSAVILGIYTLIMLTVWLSHPNYTAWHAFMTGTGMRITTLLTLLALAAHAWVGLWTVLTDYITVRHMGENAVALRLVLEVACVLMIFVDVIWGIQILWG